LAIVIKTDAAADERDDIRLGRGFGELFQIDIEPNFFVPGPGYDIAVAGYELVEKQEGAKVGPLVQRLIDALKFQVFVFVLFKKRFEVYGHRFFH